VGEREIVSHAIDELAERRTVLADAPMERALARPDDRCDALRGGLARLELAGDRDAHVLEVVLFGERGGELGSSRLQHTKERSVRRDERCSERVIIEIDAVEAARVDDLARAEILAELGVVPSLFVCKVHAFLRDACAACIADDLDLMHERKDVPLGAEALGLAFDALL